MEGLLEEGSELIMEGASPDVMDARLISAAQRIEHYEIAAYGTARTYAQLLGCVEAVELLQDSLTEEMATNENLSELAQDINVETTQSRGK